ncbi:hypothetical protein DXD23_12255 [Ruminococcus sp. TF12-2]|nr:hypothetical protein DXD23_12255 [Ruminococcus sp. TF12-2]
MLHSRNKVRIRRFKDLCCEYNFDSDVYHNDIAWGCSDDYMRNLNNQGILGDDMHLLCGQIVKIHNSTCPGYWKLSTENQCSKHFITTKQWHQDLFEEPSRLRGVDNVDET